MEGSSQAIEREQFCPEEEPTGKVRLFRSRDATGSSFHSPHLRLRRKDRLFLFTIHIFYYIIIPNHFL